MNYKSIILALTVSNILLTGCGGGSSSNDPVTAENELDGTWIENGKCVSEQAGHSEYSTFKINGIDAIFTEKEYKNTTCDSSGITFDLDTTYEIIVGSATKGSDGLAATEMDITRTGFTLRTGTLTEIPSTGVTHYSMYRINSEGKLFVAGADETTALDGSTVAKRTNDFNDSLPFTKQ